MLPERGITPESSDQAPPGSLPLLGSPAGAFAALRLSENNQPRNKREGLLFHGWTWRRPSCEILDMEYVIEFSRWEISIVPR
jgi:hypothetical protein